MDTAEPQITPEALLAHADWVRALVRGLVFDPSRADDVVQETWLEALSRGPREDRDLRSWLAVVARNVARRLGRGESRRKRREAAAARVEALPDTVDVLAKARMQRRLVDAVLELDEPYRTTLLLRWFEDLRPREIAARLGRPVNTVRTHLERGHEKLRRELDGEYGSREAWGLALLPLFGLRQQAVVQGSVLLQAGGWIMLMKWLLPSAAALVALVVTFGTGDGLSGDPETVESPGGTVADPLVAPHRPAPIQEPLEAARVEAGAAAEEATRSATGGGEQYLHSGRVLDVRGLPLAGFGLCARSENGLKFSGGTVTYPLADGSVHLSRMRAEGWEELRAHPERIDERFPGLGPYKAELLARLRGEELPLPETRTDHTGRFTFELPSAEVLIEAQSTEQYILGSGLLPNDPASTERVYIACSARPLEGRVVDVEGRPLAGAKLSAFNDPLAVAGLPFRLTDLSGRRASLLTSDEQGGFALETFPYFPGQRLSVSLEGYVARTLDVDALLGRGLVVELAKAAEPPVVTGVVLDAGGLPAQARVVFGQQDTRCDKRGRFRLEVGYLSGEPPLYAYRKGHAPAVIEDFGARYKLDPAVGADVVLRLGAPTRSLAGHVVDEEGRPVEGVEVLLLEGFPSGTYGTWLEEHLASAPHRAAKTTRSGQFELAGLFADSYALQVYDPVSSLAMVAPDVETGSSDVVLVLDHRRTLAHVTGRVVDRHGRPVAGALLSLSHERYRSPRTGAYTTTSVKLGRSAEDGSFAFEQVPYEHVSLSVSGEHVSGSVQLELEPAAAIGLELVVPLLHVFQLGEGLRREADAFLLVDGAGEKVAVTALKAGTRSRLHRATIRREQPSPTYEVSDHAERMILYRDGREVRRIELELAPNAITVVE